MRNIEIPIPAGVECNTVDQAIEQALAESGLAIYLRVSLKKFPGCVHWHIKNGRESGTLEITLWPQEHRAWFTIQDGRRADWIEDKMKRIGEFLGRHIGGNP